MITMYYDDNTQKSYKNWNDFLGYKHYSNYLKNSVYVSKIEIIRFPEDKAYIKFYLPNGYATTFWASFNIATNYFAHRSYRFKHGKITKTANKTIIEF